MWCTCITCCGRPPSSTSWLCFWASSRLRCWGASKTWWVALTPHAESISPCLTCLFGLLRLLLLKVCQTQKPSQLRPPRSVLPPPLPVTPTTMLPPVCRLTPPTTCRSGTFSSTNSHLDVFFFETWMFCLFLPSAGLLPVSRLLRPVGRLPVRRQPPVAHHGPPALLSSPRSP